MLKAIAYVRLSRDEDRKNYASLMNQRAVINTYAQKNSIKILRVYEDDNVSGYTFDRPGLNELKSCLASSDIDIIIAKDLSRIGRHNALTLLFLEDVRAAGKRIVLTDEMSGGYDSSKDDDDIIGIKTWYNERYVKDISRKIISTLREKQQRGELLIRPQFGYSIDRARNCLVPDEEKARIVREIFVLYTEGNGYRRIAECLNEKGCITPSEAIAESCGSRGREYKNIISHAWSPTHVSRILKDDVYIGSLRQGKTKKPLIKARSVRVSANEHMLFENRHEPIITKEDFYFVQDMMKRRDKVKYRGTGKAGAREGNIFSGLLFCAECGAYMVAHTLKTGEKSYVCGTYHRRGAKHCSSHRIKERQLINYIKGHLIFIRSRMKGFISSLDAEIEVRLRKEKQCGNAAGSLEKQLEALKAEYRGLLSQKLKDIMVNEDMKQTVEEAYGELERQKLQSIASVERHLESIAQRALCISSFEGGARNAVSVLNGIIGAEKPRRHNVELIVKRILIGCGGSVEIELAENIDSLCRIFPEAGIESLRQ
ncbi:DNA invertase Pin-like site-specific DNA recombinase [Anaerobacterium chartisolvens]|uniref:DNA invertase Pin-like site-specific DNA recombinase n=1 Tax=Anaerobacterium chartisolvens TaxID=1297424 RepID=A0A369BA23_9FIRM|nr:recombinase family protein [Anaerobacterium chartisolvens]RCX16534.1 DNA invertase Pin-like site-specific DNA recombinase [Anaerobacterium chartisolvens]